MPGAVASEMLPLSLRLSPNTTTWLNSVAAAALLNSKVAAMAPARWRVRNMGNTPGAEMALLSARYVNAPHTEAHAALQRASACWLRQRLAARARASAKALLAGAGAGFGALLPEIGRAHV